MIFISPFFPTTKARKLLNAAVYQACKCFLRKHGPYTHTHKDTHNFVPLSLNKAQLLWLFAMHTKRLGPSQEKLHSFLISGALLKTHQGKVTAETNKASVMFFVFLKKKKKMGWRVKEMMLWTIEILFCLNKTVKQIKWNYVGLL